MLELIADCSKCFGLCCVAPAFSASVDFAISKDAGRACPNLGADFGCRIHAQLRERGFRGCTVYDCFGAGQHVSQGTYGGRDWRSEPRSAAQMFEAFGVMRRLHELLWHLGEALKLQQARTIHGELRSVLVRTAEMANLGADELVALDVEAHRQEVTTLLRRASSLARRAVRPEAPDYAGADLIGADLHEVDLRAASFRGARLIGANLRGMDLRFADFTGADLRDADVRGADLSSALFVTQSQLEAAKSDAATAVPTSLQPPAIA